MTAPPSDLLAYHVGFVVRDLDAVVEAYRRMLGVDRWRIHELPAPKQSWNPTTSDARLKIAFGRAAGLTFEVIQVLQGRTPHLDFLEAHGDGIQHIGFWAPDVREAVEHMVSQGGRVTLARYDESSNTAEVQLTPSSTSNDIVNSLDAARLAYVDPGAGGVQLELVGPAGARGLQAWMDPEFQSLIQPSPPWS
jgi:catechol 2,3-dioxygenase-like lactoylglutathione lyase family enzyme